MTSLGRENVAGKEFVKVLKRLSRRADLAGRGAVFLEEVLDRSSLDNFALLVVTDDL